MSDVITRWITGKLGLGVPSVNDPASFRKEVANGVLIAEILRKYGLLSDDEFISLSHSHARRNSLQNMQHIHQWLIKAGMNIEQTHFTDVAEQKSGSALKLLYELFLYLEDGPRKPYVAESAKKFLMSGPMSSIFEAEYAKERRPLRRSTGESKKHSLKEEQRSSVSGLVQSTSKSKLNEKKRNWYTSLDKISAPTRVVKGAPFSQLSEVAQAETLYFSNESLMVLGSQQILRKRVENHLNQISQPHHLQIKSRLHVDKDPNLVYRLKMQQEEQKNNIEEIRKFDKKLKETKKNQIEDTTPKEGKNVFCITEGSPTQIETRVDAIKQKRQKNAQALESLSKCRKAAAHRLIQSIPVTIHRQMEADVMNQLSNLPFAERLLADFIYNTHLEKVNFKQHATFEAREKQDVNDFDLAKETQIAQEQNELKKAVLLNRKRNPSKKDSGEEIERVNQHEKMIMIDNILSDLVSLVIQRAESRSAQEKSADPSQSQPCEI